MGLLASLRQAWSRVDRVVPLPSSQSVIAESGSYALDADRSVPLVIRADDVSVDLCGRRIAGGGDPAATDAGVYIEHGRRNISLRNGSLTGFMYGVLADAGSGDPGSTGISLHGLVLVGHSFRGVLLHATHAVVDGCTVVNTGGTLVHDEAYAMGIEVHGNHCRVCRNTVSGFYGRGSGESVGISLSDEGMDDCLVEGNTVINGWLPAGSRSFGVWARNRALIRGNTLVNLTYAMAPPEHRSHANTVDNLVIGEQCTSGFFSSAKRGLRTTFITLPQEDCADCLEKALARLDRNDVTSFVRVASLLEAGGDDEQALEYYRQAAELGSAEASRWVEKLRARLRTTS